MSRPIKFLWVFANGMALCALAFCSISYLDFFDGGKTVSEQSLRDLWRLHKGDLRKLLKMAADETDSQTVQKDGIYTNPKPFLVYSQTFMRSSEVSGPIYISQNPFCFRLVISTQGLSVSGASNGIAFCSVPPKNIVTCFEGDTRTSVDSSGELFIPLEDNWYMFYEWEK